MDLVRAAVGAAAAIVINYGWEWLTLEVGFLSIFLCPFVSWSTVGRSTRPSALILWLYRWLAFRLMLGAGMSKMGSSASACWQELSCTYAATPFRTALGI